MTGEEEVFCICPYCNQQISFLFEVNYGNQSYIEDCEVCCRPIDIQYTASEGRVTNLNIDRAQ